MTQVVVSRWGNSLAVRLPKQLAEQLALTEGQAVEMIANGPVIELRAARPRKYTKYNRDELIAQIDPSDPQESFDDGPVGKELL